MHTQIHAHTNCVTEKVSVTMCIVRPPFESTSLRAEESVSISILTSAPLQITLRALGACITLHAGFTVHHETHSSHTTSRAT